MRVGIFGGAFDPPHLGHQKALSAFLREAALDLCYVFPSGRAPHKKISGGAEDYDRLEMARLTFSSLSEKIVLSDEEILKEGLSYSFETVLSVNKKHPDAEIFLFVGTDQFLVFETWKNASWLLSRVTLCVMERNGGETDLLEKKAWLEQEYDARVLLLRENAYIISSTVIREELAEKGYSSSLSPLVNDYITLREIYGFSDKKRRNLLKSLKEELSPERLAHTLSVERETDLLCTLFGLENKNEMRLAALWHDFTKEWTKEEQISFLTKEGESLREEDEKSPAVLHGFSAAVLARKNGLAEPFVSAVRYHTTGKENMTLEEKILFFADYIEETREHSVCRKAREAFYENLPSEREERLRRLDALILETLLNTKEHLLKKVVPVHPFTEKAIGDLRKEMK